MAELKKKPNEMRIGETPMELPMVPRGNAALPIPAKSPDLMEMQALQQQLQQLQQPEQPSIWKTLSNIGQGINPMDPATFQQLQQRKIGQEFDQRMDRQKFLADQIVQAQNRQRQGQQDAQTALVNQNTMRRQAEADDMDRQKFPIELETAKTNLAKAQREEAPPQRKFMDEFVNQSGKKVYAFQNPDGTVAYEEAPFELQGDTKGDTGFTLGKGQARFDSKGNRVAFVPDDAPKGTEKPEGAASPYAAERVSRAVDSVTSLIGKVSGWNTGMGSLLSSIPESDARNFKAELDTLKANIAFNELAQMREASKTGGALGQVSDREMTLLQSVLGGLDTGQSPENLRAQLIKIRDSLERWQKAQAQYGSGQPSSSPNTGGSRGAPPSRVRYDNQGRRIQ